MYKITRPEIPEVLLLKSKEWTAHLLEQRKTNSSYFIWHDYQNEKVNHILQKPLLEMTKGHCAYCDGFFEQSPKTIDHFKPKSKYPEYAFDWNNLFPCCSLCQERFDEYSDLLLKPDDILYEFEKYFYFNMDEYKIIPNPAASQEDQDRARISIEYFKLDLKERRLGIERSYKSFQKSDDKDIDCYPYRYFIQLVA